MKKLMLALAALCLLAGCSCNNVSIRTSDGTLVITSMADNALRVRMSGDLAVPALDELIYTGGAKAPAMKVNRKGGDVTCSLPGISVTYYRATGLLSFRNAEGEVILQESARQVKESEIRGVPCYDVVQSFKAPADEHIYGTGQFQDGHLDVKGLPRRLTQVNSQISVPFILSSKGYAVL